MLQKLKYYGIGIVNLREHFNFHGNLRCSN